MYTLPHLARSMACVLGIVFSAMLASVPGSLSDARRGSEMTRLCMNRSKKAKSKT